MFNEKNIVVALVGFLFIVAIVLIVIQTSRDCTIYAKNCDEGSESACINYEACVNPNYGYYQ